MGTAPRADADASEGGAGGITRRRFTIGSAVAAGAGVVAVNLVGCSSDSSTTTTGEPQVVTDDSEIVTVLSDYENADNPYEASQTWTLPLGTLLFHSEGSWAAALLTPESSQHPNTLGVLSLSSGDITTIREDPVMGSGYEFFDVRCGTGVYAWVEIDYSDRSWVLFGQAYASAAVSGDPVELDEGDIDWEPPRFTVWNSSVIWQRMPLSSGSASSEYSHCYQWSVGSADAQEIWTSPGRFATIPRVVDGILTIAPRVLEDEGVYYGMTAVDLTDGNYTKIDQLVLPSSVSPFEAAYMNETFAFSIEADYSSRGSLGYMGTFIGREGGPYIYVRREPHAQVAANGTSYFIKSLTSHLIVNTEDETYATLRAPDRSVDYGDWLASEGMADQLLTYATIRNDEGIPESVTARLFTL